MTTTQNRADEAYQKALLAAVVAVKRGFLTPDAAMDVLSDADPPGPAADQPPADPVQSVLNVNPDAPRAALTNELNGLLQDTDWMKSAWQRIELSAEQAASLSSMRPGSGQLEEARAVLTALARERLQALRERLPLSNETRYSVVREFARGGMGRILIATDNAVGREVALKEVLVPEDAQGRDPTDADPEAVERFLREAKVTGQLDHPGIVPVYEISRRQDGSIFYTMKLVRGASMTARMEAIANSGKTDAQKFAERMKLLEAFLDVCHAIAYAHSRGVIHRDLKPDNIMLGDYGEAVVLDWGLARVRGTEDVAIHRDTPRFSQSLMKNAQESHTLAGSVMGTPGYMSPEQAAGQLQLVDERSDVYALGAILYQILAGHQPYNGGGAMTVVEQVLAGDPTPLKVAAPFAPPDLVTLAEKAMARDREKRVASAAELAAEIAAFRGGRTLSVYNYSSAELLKRFVARNKATVSVGALAACVLVVVGVFTLLSIRAERDVATGALAAKDIAESEQERIRQEQQDKRAELVRIARERLATQRAELGRIAPDPAELTRQSEDLLPLLRRTDRSEGDREAAAGMISRLLNAATARTEFLRLALEPVAGQREQLAPEEEVAREQEQLLLDWLCAARLAAANDDFFLAELILSYTQGGDERRKAAAEEIRVAKTALLGYRRDRIARILAYIRAGKEDDNVPVNAARVQDYTTEVGGWREQQTVDLLAEALQSRIESARAEPAGTIWNVRQRFEIQFISDVLVQVGLAERAVPALSQLMMALSDHDLVVHLAFTLCRLQHSSAWRPLVELRYKYGAESAVWTRVKRQFRRVPEPQHAGNPVGPAERLNLALLRLEQKRLEQARSDLEAILVEHPAHQDTLFELSRAQSLFRASGWVENANLLVDRLLKENPFHGRGLAWKAELMRYRFPQVRTGSTEEEVREAHRVQQDLLAQAVAASPRDWWVYRTCSEHRFTWGADGETLIAADLAPGDINKAIEFGPQVPDLYYWRARYTLAEGALAAEEEDEGARGAAPKALVDVNRAIDMDPENSLYLSSRARIHELRSDLDASARDYSRAIELDPGYFRHYESRGYLRLRMKDFKGALEDFEVVIELRGEDYPPAFANRARAYEEMGEFREAIRWFQKYIDMRPGFWDNPRIQEKIEALEKKLEEGSGE